MPAKTSLPIFCLLLAFSLSGCPSTRWEKETHHVRIQTTPPGASVWYQDSSGQHAVGESPVDLERDVEVGYYEFNPWMWVAAGVSSAGLAGSATWAAYAPETDDTQQGIAIALSIVTGIAVLITVPGTIAGQCYDGSKNMVQDFELDVGADMPGHKGSSLKVAFPPQQETVSLLLHRTDEPQKDSGFKVTGAIGSLKGDLAEPPPPVVAVFDINDSNNLLKRKDRDQLTEYLATCLTQARKARVVPREQIRERLQKEKTGTFRRCFEESCQIELGRAVAAEKSLSTTLLRVGKKCALTVNLYDLKTETAEKGATEECTCKLDDLMSAIKKVADKL